MSRIGHLSGQSETVRKDSKADAGLAARSKYIWRKRVGVEPTFDAREGLERQL